MLPSNFPGYFICLLFYFLLPLNWSQIYSIQLRRNHRNGIDDLQVVGDYRSIKLKWNYFNNKDDTQANFKIKYCEMNNWPILKSRCKHRIVEPTNNSNNITLNIPSHQESDEQVIIDFKNSGQNHYEASINSLRVQTNYSVSVEAVNQPKTNSIDDNNEDFNSQINTNPIIVSTKSFTAKTLRCLANSSQIQVFTGPYFKGRITVEGVDNPSCFLDGDGTDPKESYNFTIDHDLCKSKIIDKTRIETMVLVNENREILTHNSRRYLVICGFDPEKYTLTASVAVPNFLLKKIFDRLKDPRPQSEIVKQRINNYSVEKIPSMINNKNRKKI